MSEINSSSVFPKFPEFWPINFESKEIIEAITHRYNPYSDFNFNSLYSWNTDSSYQFSILNNNLVIKINDYLTGESLYSIFGDKEIDTSLKSLINYLDRASHNASLKLIPEIVIDSIEDKDHYTISEDLNNHDYIFSIPMLSELRGNQFKSKRYAANFCEKQDLIEIKFHYSSSIHKDNILSLFKEWESVKRRQDKLVDVASEHAAVTRILNIFDKQSNLLLTTAVFNGNLVGISIDEFLPNKFVLSHFFKTLPIVKGLSEYLNREVARELLKHGAEFWNWEQDMGLESLRRMKLGYRPAIKHNKYQVTIRQIQ